MTLNLGFNVKFYEMATIALFCCIIFDVLNSGIIALEYKIIYKKVYKSLVILFLSYAFTNMVSYWYFIDNIIDKRHIYHWSVGRYSPGINTLVALGYIAIAILTTMILLEFINPANFRKLIQIWVASAMVSVLYLFYTNISLHLSLPELILPGMDDGIQHGNLLGIEFARSGTFKEGNFLSGYLLTSALLSHHLYSLNKHYYYLLCTLLFIFSIFITISTTGTLSIILFLLVFYTLKTVYITKVSLFKLFKQLIIMFIAIVGFIISPLSGYFKEVIISKIFAADVNDSASAYSKFDRLDVIEKAWSVFLDYPLTGVGTYNFGYYYPSYASNTVFSDGTLNKKIPNNVYIQILCENGIITFIAFVVFVITVFTLFIKKKYKNESDIVFMSLFVCILFKWLAYPTLTLIYDWISIAFIIFVLSDNRNSIMQQHLSQSDSDIRSNYVIDAAI